MSAGLFFVHLVYPDLLHVATPSGYFLSPKGRRAIIRVNKHHTILQLTDLTNSMVPIPDDPLIFIPHHEITSKYHNDRHWRIGHVTQEQMDTILATFKEHGVVAPRIFHRVTFDTHENGLYRVFETRYATDP